MVPASIPATWVGRTTAGPDVLEVDFPLPLLLSPMSVLGGRLWLELVWNLLLPPVFCGGQCLIRLPEHVE